MIKHGVLLIPHPALMEQRLGGLSVLERQAWTARRAGIEKLWIGARRPDEPKLAALRLPEGLELVWSQAAAPLECPTPYVALSGDHLIRTETLSWVCAQNYPSAVDLADAAGDAVVQVVPLRSDMAPMPQRQELPEGTSCVLALPGNRDDALGWLLALGIKPTDGFMAKNFDRHISLAVSRLLLDTKVSPNLMTIVSSMIGLTGAFCFVVPEYGARLLGASLVWLHSVLDGCDGELSRIRFQESPLGADLDFWGDNLVHVALFASLGAGFWRADGSTLPLMLGAAACAGTLGSALLNYRERLAKRRNPALAAKAAPSGALRKLEIMLAARDFVYLLLFLAWIGRTYEFLWASAIGSMLFFVLMLYLGRNDNEQALQPNPAR